MSIQSQFVVHSPVFPIYSDVKTLMTIWKEFERQSRVLWNSSIHYGIKRVRHKVQLIGATLMAGLIAA